MLCPNCLRKEVLEPLYRDHDSEEYRCPHCKMFAPIRYVLDYDNYPPVVFSIVGQTGHGKTVYLASLLHELDKIQHEWPDFHYSALDDEGLNDIRLKRDALRLGVLPAATPQAFPRPVIVRLHGVPDIGNRHLLMYDTSGETFDKAADLRRFGGYVSHSCTIIWLLSLSNINTPDDLSQFITVYLQGYAELGGALREQNLLLVLTKADSLLSRPDLPASVREMLGVRGWQQSMETCGHYDALSSDLECWLTDMPGYANVIRNLRAEFKSVRFCAVSALGSEPADGTGRVNPDPRGVLLPLVWTLEHDLGTLSKSAHLPRLIPLTVPIVTAYCSAARRSVCTVSKSGEFQLISLRSGDIEETWQPYPLNVAAAVFDSDATLAFVRDSQGSVFRYDLNKRNRDIVSLSKNDQAEGLAISSDGTAIAISIGSNITVYNAISLEIIGQLRIDPIATVRAISFGPEGERLACGLNDGTVQVWAWKEKRLLMRRVHEPLKRSWEQYFTGPLGGMKTGISSTPDPVTMISFLPDGLCLVSGTNAGNIVFWKIDVSTSDTPPRLDGSVCTIACSPDGHYIVAGDVRGTVYLYDIRSGAARRLMSSNIPVHKHRVNTLAFSPDGALLISGGIDATLQFYPLP